VIVDGRGRLGRHSLAPIHIHYTDAGTPYGPIVAEAEGLRFFTLRPRPNKHTYFLPESRNSPERKAGRELVCHVDLKGGDSFKGSVSVTLEHLWDEYEDGLAAFLLRVGPKDTVVGPDPKQGGGQYYVVVNGTMYYGGKELPRLSLLFASDEELPPRITAGESGFDALVLQFPHATISA